MRTTAPPTKCNEEKDADNNTEVSSKHDSIHVALAAAATANRHQLDEQNDDFGAGKEEWVYQASLSAAQGWYSMDDDGDSIDMDVIDGQNIKPQYEQLKWLWTLELACPQLLLHHTKTVPNVGELTEQEDITEELFQKPKHQRHSCGALDELASLE